jgi:hypothetical protein
MSEVDKFYEWLLKINNVHIGDWNSIDRAFQKIND